MTYPAATVLVADDDRTIRRNLVRLLESATRSIRAQGGRVVLSNGMNAEAQWRELTDGHEEFQPDNPGRPPRKQQGHPLLR